MGSVPGVHRVTRTVMKPSLAQVDRSGPVQRGDGWPEEAAGSLGQECHPWDCACTLWHTCFLAPSHP